MLTFDKSFGEKPQWYFVHVKGRVFAGPFAANHVVSTVNCTMFEGTETECNGEYKRLGLLDAETPVKP